MAVFAATTGAGDSQVADERTHQALEGERVELDGLVYYPDAFANSVTRQVLFMTYLTDASDESDLPSPLYHISEIWVERDANGLGKVL